MLEAGGWARGPARRWSWLVGEGGVLLNCCRFRVLMQSMLGTNIYYKCQEGIYFLVAKFPIFRIIKKETAK